MVCTAERGLCGPFNSSIVRIARDKANALIADGKEVKILLIGRKGYDQLRRLYGKLIIETSNCVACAPSASSRPK